MMRYSKGKCEVLFGYKKKLDTVLLYGAPKGRNCCFWQNSDPEFSVRDKIENRIVLSCIYLNQNLLSLMGEK